MWYAWKGREIFRVFVGNPEGNKPIGRIWELSRRTLLKIRLVYYITLPFVSNGIRTMKTIR